ncbi:hypothetical protein MAAFP003_132 [Mycobacterium ahvazicum]|uniref:DUF2867 domain-containing protein n=2 Tax=Mycobacterium ahvazicum TaxID=1964395 RepID=A0A2K4Y3W2_9MYCO|nr:hypothetical protein MAAFP003_132 [Mycobacterium ahvazicum]
MGAERMLIESAVPAFDAMLDEHVVVAADPATTYRAARGLDLLTVRTPLLAASMWLRNLLARLSGRAVPTPPRLVLGENELPGWLVLGDRPNREFAFGAIGKFWQPVIEWRDVTPADFTTFAEPGWAKIGANFSVAAYGDSHSLLSYQCRTATTDPAARRNFLRYWWLIRPFAAHIMRATLKTIRANAEAAARSAGDHPPAVTSGVEGRHPHR